MKDYAELEKRLRERVREMREAGALGFAVTRAPPTHVMLIEAAEAIADLTRKLEALDAAVQTLKDRCERECNAARERKDEPAAYLFEGGYTACEAITAEVHALLSTGSAVKDDASPADNPSPDTARQE